MILLYDDPSLCSRLLLASQGAGPALLAWVHRKLRSNAAGPLHGSLLAPSVLQSRHKKRNRKAESRTSVQPTNCVCKGSCQGSSAARARPRSSRR